MAQSLHISAKTIESHRGHMRQKLKLATGAELIRFAISHVEKPA
jgi:DNA-binding CsgD family transcriptional regulator